MALKIGAMVESFRKGFRGGVEAAAALGVDGVQAYATNGELSVANMTPDRIKEVLDIVKSNGLCFSAICGDFGKGFLHAELNDELVEKSKGLSGRDLKEKILKTAMHKAISESEDVITNKHIDYAIKESSKEVTIQQDKMFV